MTTPSGKKSAGKSTGRSAQSKTGQTKTGSNKAGQAKKASPAKKSAPRKSTRKKKPGGRGVLLAFAAGLIIASAGFWFLRDASLPDFSGFVAGVTQRPAAEQSVKQPDRSSEQSRPGAENAKAGQARRASETQHQGMQQASRPPASRPHASRPDASAQAPAPPVSGVAADDEARREAARSSAVASALKELQDLPYEEPLEESLDDRVRQMDYAVMQAAWQLKLPPGALRLASAEDRRVDNGGGEHYRHQVIEVLPGATSSAFVKALRGSLGKWAEGANARELGGDRWALSINGVTTHELRLYPGKSAFPTTAAVLPPPAPHEYAPPVVSRPRHPDAEAKLAIVIDDLGASKAAVDTLLALDYPVTCAFWPHAGHTAAGARAAHAKGREVIVHLPMEPVGYPAVKPGPNVLLTGMDAVRIRAVTEAGIAAVPYAVGLNNHMGSRFTQQAQGVKAVLDVLKARGMFMLDSLTHSRSVFGAEARRMGVAHHRRNVFLDVEHSKAKVLEALRKAERIALLSGHAVAIGHPLPETLAALKEWQRLRNKKIRIVRLSDLPQS